MIEMILHPSYSSNANLYNVYNNNISICSMIGYSTNIFDTELKNIYTFRQDNFYIKNLGNLTFNFTFTQPYYNYNDLPFSDNEL